MNGDNSYISPSIDELFSPYLDDRAKQLWDCSQGPTPALDWNCFDHSAGGNLKLSYDPGRDPARPNMSFSYKLKIQNPGSSAATGVVLNDVNNYAIVSAKLPGGSCNINGQSVTCTLATLPAHATANVTLVVNAPADTGATIGNTVSITFDQLKKWDVQEYLSTDVKAGK